MKTRKINKALAYTFIIITISLAFYYISSSDDGESINCTSAFSIVNDGEEFLSLSLSLPAMVMG
jgi:hypothetical protein